VSRLSPYRAALGAGWRAETAYRAPLVADALSTTLMIVLLVSIWRAVYAARGGEPAGGYTAAEMTTYLVAANLLALLLGSGVDGRLDQEIQRGDHLSGLIRPVSYPVAHAALGLASVSVRVACVGLPLLLLAAVTLDLAAPRPAGVLLCLLSAALATALAIAVRLSVGMVGLVTVNSWGARHLYNNVQVALSGQVVALELLPGGLRPVVEALPFASMVSTPARLLLGRYDGAAEAAGLLGRQAGWLLAATAVAALVWRVVRRSATAVGG
jgi:ABC-2 type transport system permease protein